MMEINKIYCENCLDTLSRMPDNFIDAVVTDPPYGLSFMGKKWDYDVPPVEIWQECLRVLKPGGYLLAFAGTRTQHRMAVRIEDAGFEIRDMIAWVYGSGFPKSLDIGKAVDKMGGESLRWFIDYILKVAEERGVSKKELTMLFPSKNGNPTGWIWNKQNTQAITLEQYHKIRDFLHLPFDDIKECEREIVGRGKSGLTAGTIANFAGEKEFDLTKGASEWEGWGTSLKPSFEPVTVARKPIEGTVAENVLKWGTGGINIDACRVGMSQDDTNMLEAKSSKNPTGKKAENVPFVEGIASRPHTQGRFPANFIHDGSDEVLSLFPNPHGAGHKRTASEGTWNNTKGMFNLGAPAMRFGDTGSAARFFYCAKASKSERDQGCGDVFNLFEQSDGLEEKTAGECTDRQDGSLGLNSPRAGAGRNNGAKNHHPTVKPIALMEYLIKLVSREGALIYDPFAGSGSTGIAAAKLKRNFILSELSPEYVKIAEKRLQPYVY